MRYSAIMVAALGLGAIAVAAPASALTIEARARLNGGLYSNIANTAIEDGSFFDQFILGSTPDAYNVQVNASAYPEVLPHPDTLTNAISLDPGDNYFATTTQLSQAIATTSLQSFLSNQTANNPFSLTLDWVLTVASSGDVRANLVSDLTYVPEPLSAAVLGAGLVGLGVVRRRRMAK